MTTSLNPKRNITKTTTIIMLSVFISRILGFFRTMLIPEKFGGFGNVSDAYNIAFLLPDLMYSLIVGGSIAAALIPVLAGYVETGKEKKGWHSVSIFLNIIFIAMVVVSLIGIIFAPSLLNLAAAGFKNRSYDEIKIAVTLTRILFPSVCFLMLAGLCNGILNSYHRFAAAAFGPCFYNLLCVLSILFLSNGNPDENYGVVRVVTGIVICSFLYFLFQLLFTMKNLKNYRFVLNIKDKDFKKLIKLAVPSLLTTSVMQINIIISNSFSTLFPKGGVTALNLANKTWQMPLGIIAQSVGVALLPTISASFAAGRMDEFKGNLSKGIKNVLFLCIPSAIGMIILSEPVIRTLFKFSDNVTAQDIKLTSGILSLYAIALIAQSVNTILNRAFFAVKDTLTPFYVGMVTISFNILFSYVFIQKTKLGVSGIALAYSLAAIINFTCLIILFNKKTKKSRMDNIIKFVFKCTASAAVMAVFLYIADNMLFKGFKNSIMYLQSKSTQVIYLAGIIISGAVFYFIAALILRMPEAKKIFREILKRTK